MFEFELKGEIDELEKFEKELLEYLGFGNSPDFCYKEYDELKNHYGVSELGHEHEKRMCADFGNVVFCKKFPSYTSPFWNMKRLGKDYSTKIDVIINGQETIGSAERSTNPDEMKNEFYTISGGGYAQKLFDLFGKKRVERELEKFLSLNFFPRCGGGIGLTRLIEAVKQLS